MKNAFKIIQKSLQDLKGYISMKTLVLAGLTAAGKTTISYELEKRLPNVTTLHFDKYSYEGEVEDFYKWSIEGADFN